jgi:hypothetical protein
MKQHSSGDLIPDEFRWDKEEEACVRVLCFTDGRGAQEGQITRKIEERGVARVLCL